MRTSAAFFCLVLLILAMLACETSSPPVPQGSVFPASSQPATGDSGLPAATAPSTMEGAPTGANPALRTNPDFRVAVIVDSLSERVTREQAEPVIAEASTFLRQFTPIGLMMMDFVEDGAGGTTTDMATRYIATRSASLPDGIIIFSFGDNGQARISGGYGYSLSVLGAFKNAFVSPTAGDQQMYVAVVHFSHKYMACGYGSSDTVQSASSVGDECGGQAGTACTSNNGYSMCANAVGHLYTSTPTHFVSSSIIHELLHNFSPNGDKDNYDTPECKARMGYPAAYFDLQESQYYNGLCPFVYEEFKKSYRP